METPSKRSGRVQEIQNRRHHTTAHKHGGGTKVPQEEREGEIEGPQPEEPEVESSVQVPSHVLAVLFFPSGDGHGD